MRKSALPPAGGVRTSSRPEPPAALSARPRSYDAWFQRRCPGCDPLATGEAEGMDWNSWRGAPYVYNESWHPTAWVGATAAAWLSNFSAQPTPRAPFLLKVSFHRPHSPYDPPQRVLNTTLQRTLPPIVVAADGWDHRYVRAHVRYSIVPRVSMV